MILRNCQYKTQPVAVHAPGWLHTNKLWPWVLAMFKKSRMRPAKKCPELSIITWNSGTHGRTFSRPGKQLGTFERCCDMLQIPYVVLGGSVGKRWLHRMKIPLTCDFLRRVRTPYVAGFDSADVLFFGEPSKLVNVLQMSGSRAIFNAEARCSPAPISHAICGFEKSVAKAPFCYFNAGVWVAETACALKIFEWGRKICERQRFHSWSEQICLHYVYRDMYPEMRIDDRCELFQVLNGPCWLSVEPGKML